MSRSKNVAGWQTLPSLFEALSPISHTWKNKIKAFRHVPQGGPTGRSHRTEGGELHPTDEGKIEFPYLTETPSTPCTNSQEITHLLDSVECTEAVPPKWQNKDSSSFWAQG